MDEITIMKEQAKLYLDTAEEKIVRMVYAMLQVDAETDWWDDIPEGAKVSIERGMNDAEEGRVTSNADVMSKYAKWLS
jgi:predicted transcriptional regulator